MISSEEEMPNVEENDASAIVRESQSSHICKLSPNLCKKVMRCKVIIYNNIILSPQNMESNEAHDNRLLQKYISVLKYVQDNAINMANNNNNVISTYSWKRYPNKVKRTVMNTLDYISQYITNNKNRDTLLFNTFITMQMSVLPFYLGEILPT